MKRIICTLSIAVIFFFIKSSFAFAAIQCDASYTCDTSHSYGIHCTNPDAQTGFWENVTECPSHICNNNSCASISNNVNTNQQSEGYNVGNGSNSGDSAIGNCPAGMVEILGYGCIPSGSSSNALVGKNCPAGTDDNGQGLCLPSANLNPGPSSPRSISCPAGYFGDGYGNCIQNIPTTSVDHGGGNNNSCGNSGPCAAGQNCWYNPSGLNYCSGISTNTGGTGSPNTAPNTGGTSSVGGGSNTGGGLCNSGWQLATNNSNLCCPTSAPYVCSTNSCVSDASQCSGGSGSSNQQTNTNTNTTNTTSSSKSPLGGYCNGTVNDCNTSKGTLSGDEKFDCVNSTCVIRHPDGGASAPVSNTDCDSGIDCTSGGVSPDAICIGSGTDHTNAYCIANKVQNGYQCDRNEECQSGQCAAYPQNPQYKVCTGSAGSLNTSTGSEAAPTPGTSTNTQNTTCEGQDVNGCFNLYYAGHPCTWQGNQNQCVTIQSLGSGAACTYDNACASNTCTNGTCSGAGNQGGVGTSTSCTGLQVNDCFNAASTLSSSDPHYNGGYACVWSDSLGCQKAFSVASGQSCTFSSSCQSGVCNSGTCQ